ncbi:hypothetical protein KALB_407 [Kutzneria albida DSM 43870]|uniref:VanZ-like domain-containing protein n=1 Tax=Kutzneria albida DSM 43870 TaxID=1449976 RepID=W5W6H6_9PSEU|nr:hypothetical protein KALB_407 [Kutzneria albida DSM 43870]
MAYDSEVGLTKVILAQPGVLAATAVGCVVLGFLALLAALLFGWNKLPAVLAACGLSLALAVTLVRGDFTNATPHLINPLSVCLRNSFSLKGSWELLNFVMLMPVGFFGVLATRRPILVALGCALVSAAIEVSQAVFELGVCEKQDFLNNSVGAAVAALAGWLLLALFGGRRTDRARRATSSYSLAR